MSIATVMGGVMSLDIPSFLQAWNHLSPIKWSVASLAPYSLRGVVFTCTDFQRLPNGDCPIRTGEDVLRLYRLSGSPGQKVLALGLCVVGYRLLAYVILKFRRTRWGSSGRSRTEGSGRRRLTWPRDKRAGNAKDRQGENEERSELQY